MKLIAKSIILSLLLHIVLVISFVCYGLWQTWSHKPDLYNNQNVTILQQEVAFGYTVSPMFFIITFVVSTLSFVFIIKLSNLIKLKLI
ncbi:MULTISPECIES: hypothetical protein [Sutcliffiella]|uniref:Uncharacterized protein n=1 Tax=Sutcliffiella cohnii TaxID=33932 RepID=A0A223KQ53_9BACI|nr:MULTISPECIES: hypothetical protein [Sutcliffiella]AST91484.1 hypothetical protein BC6307_09420 [Sutcliffiella cohnii]MED4014950.1 hypothetical protein [Sutcliffiella cohnii]WBL17316.1 hypothetical protein O1A01_12060 [Sutcliffiella sp. NC1]